MLGIEEIMCELEGGDGGGGSPLPPGFRFHPTDEELITFYLASKVFNGTFSGVDIAQVDLNRCEPWELPDVAKMGEREWYFFSLRDRKYPTGLRTNRATGAGYWKATGKDREVYSSTGSGRGTGTGRSLLGMKKTLVFYKGRAPRGEKTKWVMHEYRLDGDFSYRHTCKEEWVICRIFHKMGEKKHGDRGGNIIIHQGQSYNHQLLEHQPPNPSPTTTNTNNSLPPLLESSTTPSPSPSLLLEPCNPFLFHHHESDLKSPSFPIFQTPPKDNTETNANPSPSPSPSIFKSLLSNQDFFTIPKQCKTEAIFSHPFPANLGGLDKTNHHHQHHQFSPPSYSHNPMLDFGVDSAMAFTGGGTKLATGGTTTSTHPIPWSSATSLNKYGLHQMLLDMI